VGTRLRSSEKPGLFPSALPLVTAVLGLYGLPSGFYGQESGQSRIAPEISSEINMGALPVEERCSRGASA
jgi:hypothetical protein